MNCDACGSAMTPMIVNWFCGPCEYKGVDTKAWAYFLSADFDNIFPKGLTTAKFTMVIFRTQTDAQKVIDNAVGDIWKTVKIGRVETTGYHIFKDTYAVPGQTGSYPVWSPNTPERVELVT